MREVNQTHEKLQSEDRFYFHIVLSTRCSLTQYKKPIVSFAKAFLHNKPLNTSDFFIFFFFDNRKVYASIMGRNLNVFTKLLSKDRTSADMFTEPPVAKDAETPH